MDLISVIVPVYNVEKYLPKCIESIINQTYNNLEIILVDDGSPDNCGKICDEYALKDSRIKVIHKENGGLSDARNCGLDVARGEYISFVDSDDYIHSDLLGVLYAAVNRDKSDVAICNFQYVDEAGREFDGNVKIYVRDEVLTGYQVLERLDPVVTYVVSWAKLYKRELFEKLRFEVGKIHEDEFIAHRVFNKCDSVSCVSHKLYFYLQRNNSISNRKYTCKSLDVVEALIDRMKFYFENSYDSLAINSINGIINSYNSRIAFIDKCRELKIRKKTIRKLYRSVIFSYIKNVLKNTTKKQLVLIFLFSIHPICYNSIIALCLKIRRKKKSGKE